MHWCHRRRRPTWCCAHLAGEDIREWFTRMPWKPGHSPLRHHPDYEAYLFWHERTLASRRAWRGANGLR
jgi:hypothetical protein